MPSSDLFQTPRRVLRPGTTVEDVDALAQLLRWPMTGVTERDRAAGTDGRVTWQADGPALHYGEDAMFGIGHYRLAGGRQAVEAVAGQAAEALDAWTVKELCAAVDDAPDARARGQAMLRLGLAAHEFDDEVHRRIAAALADDDPRIRYAALFAASYSGYGQFGGKIAGMAAGDPEGFVRDRAAAIAHVRR
ncbi:hypothetical protein BTM25_57430 [Actinomadura rubteroloni]|uniref:HEAT repeat domain-containing protein n=1 Tax=Actinomadura rubteroloni TaxID=1926885 RepID=A0A2P4UBA3_9ACTN|nr:hypothetical protein [Actinomadura rubteroloni]POM22331.1 hypothetical protein BTM25_57430 [Actinomadura rubteroloni]